MNTARAAGAVVKVVDYAASAEAIRAIRDEVFVREQGVPVELEHDAQDALAVHVLAVVGDVAVATGRITPEGRIGRMAVLAPYRGRGIGRAVLLELLGAARRAGLARVYCHAQRQAVPFYVGAGFVTEGVEFLEIDKPHQRMAADLGHA